MNADLLVKLYELPDLAPAIQRQTQAGVTIRRAIAPEKHVVVDWVLQTFGQAWSSETEVAYSNHPASCFIATENDGIIGFGCYNATGKGFFGPTGVDETKRGRGIGVALLLACLHAMYAEGFGYAIIGAAGPVDFYARAVNATVIEGSSPGIYRGMLTGKK
ncbi:MAG: GNAT family N-acetyltransferase [Anaerolineaceae bacterium]|nr:GNAT family N-acetyltransferase [Anaerolineaceae bacterium]